jgi:ABC-type nitrate/sulfonate/bicarbonate transport system substrate-binding protein
LYRNNPLHSTGVQTEYVKKSEEITVKLEARIKRIAEEKEAKRLAEELAARLEKERLEKQRVARLTERKQQYSELLTFSFKIWIQSLWRKDPGALYLTEIVNNY